MDSKEFKQSSRELEMAEQRLVDHKKRNRLKWTAPVVVGVLLPTHAQATHETTTTTTTTTLPPAPCADPVITAQKNCKGAEADIEITISTTDASTLIIGAVPTFVAPGWAVASADPVPANVTSGSPYNMVISGLVVDPDSVNCIPGTDVPINGGVAFDSIPLNVSFTCESDGASGSVSVDLLSLV